MTLIDACALLLAGFAASAVNAVAGGGSLITFPTLVAIGLPPVAANVTNSLAVSPGYVSSVYGSRDDLAEVARKRGRAELLRLLPTAIVGTAAGCVLLLSTPERAFELIVPFLVLGAAAVLAFQQRLRQLVGHPRDLEENRQRLATHATVALGAVYGGYFGAALGVMLVAVLGLVLDETLAHITALKNAISAVVGVVTVVAFGVFGPVNWAAVGVLVPATILGGYAGSRLARRLPANLLRGIIVVAGVVVGVILLARAL
jgi:uncharacterized protein